MAKSKKTTSPDNISLPVSKKTMSGVVGAVVGSVIAGPVGAVVGGVAGTIMGDRVSKGQPAVPPEAVRAAKTLAQAAGRKVAQTRLGKAAAAQINALPAPLKALPAGKVRVVAPQKKGKPATKATRAAASKTSKAAPAMAAKKSAANGAAGKR